MSQVLSLAEAVEATIRDGDTVAMEGFTHLIPHAAGHEVIRQRRKHLNLIRMTPDIIYDQLIGMSCADSLMFSWGGNPGVGSLHRMRDANGWPHRCNRRTHTSPWPTAMRLSAGLPCAIFRGYIGVDLPRQPNIRRDLSVHRRTARRDPPSGQTWRHPRPEGGPRRQRVPEGIVGAEARGARAALPVTAEEIGRPPRARSTPPSPGLTVTAIALVPGVCASLPRTATTCATMPTIRLGTRLRAIATAFSPGCKQTCSTKVPRCSPLNDSD